MLWPFCVLSDNPIPKAINREFLNFCLGLNINPGGRENGNVDSELFNVHRVLPADGTVFTLQLLCEVGPKSLIPTLRV